MGITPYVREWIEHVLGVHILKETNQLSKDQKDTVKRMMSPKKFTNMVHGLPTRWTNQELERIGKEIMGHSDFTRALVFHPKKEKELVDAIFVHLTGNSTPSV